LKQRDQSDCGPTCLAYVAHRHGRRVSIAQLRLAGGTNQQGTTALGLVAAARAAGLSARGFRSDLKALGDAPVPFIAHCRLPNHLLHYVVVCGLRLGQRVRVMDPAVGREEWWTWERFEAAFTGVLLLISLDSSAVANDEGSSVCRAPWRRLWALLQPHRSLWLQAFVGSVFSTVLALSTSLYVQNLMDRVIPDGDRRLLILMSLGMLVVLGLRTTLGVLQSRLALHTAQQIDAGLILGYYRRLLRLPQPFFDSMRAGEIVSRVSDAVKIREFLNNTLLNLALQPLILLFALGAMFVYSWKLGLLALSLIPLQAAVWWIANRCNRRQHRVLMERSADFDAQLVESLQTQHVIRGLGLEDDFSLRTENRLVRLLRAVRRATNTGIATGTASTVLTQGFSLLLLWLGTTLVLGTEITPGELFSCYTLAGYLTGPAVALVGLNASIQQALVATDRLYEIMDLELEKDAGTISFVARHAAGPLVFEGVTFRHAGRMPVLTDFSAEFAPGRITALAGESGCGKSTVLALLQRLYRPEKGRILFGEIDIAHFTLGSLRSGIGFVPQKVELFAGTILENLVPGAAEPDLEWLIQLCRETAFLDFVDRQPQGILTPLSENGLNLSGGQRQKLAIVRALYRQPSILLLDEPSSALDGGAESQLMYLLQRRRERGTTIVMAAHNPRLLTIADHVIRMESRPEPTTHPVAPHREAAREANAQTNGVSGLAVGA
jgi:ATP-binding cassette, subfamily C, bacteriocin exporter